MQQCGNAAKHDTMKAHMFKNYMVNTVPGTRYQVLGTKYSGTDTMYLVPVRGTRYRIPSPQPREM